jgi:phosphohistidine swiveling domain-containing protein
MASLFTDTNKYDDGEGPPIVEAYHSAIKALIRRRLEESRCGWRDFVFGTSYELLTTADMKEIERQVLESGYRFQSSAMISALERPDAYLPIPGSEGNPDEFSFQHPEAKTAPPDDEGRLLVGQGDNVVEHSTNVVGTARYFRSIKDVAEALSNGVAKGTIAVIDDSGGTLTAPILEQFAGVICAGGTVRSHLGILTREYGIPCLMNSRVTDIRNGDQVELEVSGPAKTTEAYQTGIDMSVRVWKLPL